MGILDAVGSEGSIVVYSSYERGVMKRLAEEFPQYREGLLALYDRLFDLLAIVRTHYYHPDFHGSYSIKAVLPALVPDMTYSNLEISIGALFRCLRRDDCTRHRRIQAYVVT